jgi:8-oxo-dGTP pyrophosphatase MutT (NUDIX family)
MPQYLKDLKERVGDDPLLIPSVLAIPYDEHNLILLAKHIESEVCVAQGGSINPHEAPADAVVREAWEETS